MMNERVLFNSFPIRPSRARGDLVFLLKSKGLTKEDRVPSDVARLVTCTRSLSALFRPAAVDR